jgi:hypothetical protein
MIHRHLDTRLRPFIDLLARTAGLMHRSFLIAPRRCLPRRTAEGTPTGFDCPLRGNTHLLRDIGLTQADIIAMTQASGKLPRASRAPVTPEINFHLAEMIR